MWTGIRTGKLEKWGRGHRDTGTRGACAAAAEGPRLQARSSESLCALGRGEREGDHEGDRRGLREARAGPELPGAQAADPWTGGCSRA